MQNLSDKGNGQIYLNMLMAFKDYIVYILVTHKGGLKTVNRRSVLYVVGQMVPLEAFGYS